MSDEKPIPTTAAGDTGAPTAENPPATAAAVPPAKQPHGGAGVPPTKPAPAFPPFPPEPEAELAPEQEAEAEAFREGLGDAVLSAGLSGRYLRLSIAPQAIVDAASFAAGRGYNYLSDVVATDLIGSDLIRVAYILTNIPDMRRNLILQVHVPRSAPTLPTVTDVFKGAEWPEREAYDLVGVVFEGHPDLRRIMLPDEWEGHPLRKDYTFID